MNRSAIRLEDKSFFPGEVGFKVNFKDDGNKRAITWPHTALPN